MTTPHDDKYVVFKREEFEEWIDPDNGDWFGVPSPPPECEDAVVIRRRDVFAGPGLHAYAGAVFSGIAVLETVGTHERMLTRLKKIADYFHEQAVAAESSSIRRIPD